MSSTFSTNLHLEEPALGDYANSWNVPLNSNLTILDAVTGSSTSVALSSSNVTLSVAQAAFHTIILTGALSASVQLILSGAIGGRRYIWNTTTGNFSVSVLNGAGDTGGGIAVPQGLLCPVILTGGQAFYDSYQACPAGVIFGWGGFQAPPGFVLAYGQSYATTAAPLLFQAYGYFYGGAGGSFNVPDLRGRILAGADNMGGSAANRLNGYALGVSGGEQTHLLVTGEMPSHTHPDSGHGHGTTESPHVHAGAAGQFLMTTGMGASLYIGVGTPIGGQANTAGASTGLTINTGFANNQNTGGGGAHNNIQPTFAVNYIIRF